MSMVKVKRKDLPALTDERLAELEALAKMPEEDIDLSDIPEQSAEFWASAEVGKFYRPNKTHTTIRIDADVLAWLKAQGKGYQTKLNAILRKAMLDSSHKS